MKKIICFAFLPIVFACTSEYGEIKNIKPNDVVEIAELRVNDTVVYPLPPAVSHIITAFDYNVENQVFSFYTSDTVYRYKKGTLYHKIRMPHRVSTFSTKNDFLWAINYNSERLFQADSLGSILKDFRIVPSIKYYPLPITKISPIIEEENKVFFFGNISGEYSDEDDENRNVIGIYDIETQKVAYSAGYPKEYEHNFGGGLFRWVYADYNPKERKIIVSFPASHSLWVYDIDDLEQSKSFYAGSRFVKSTQYLKIPKILPIDAETKMKHFAETPSYSRVIFDPFRDVYYRIAEKETVYEGMVGWSKEIAVIILDKSFNVIGETFIGKCLSIYKYAIYVDANGLNIPIDSSEDVLIFKNYKIWDID